MAWEKNYTDKLGGRLLLSEDRLVEMIQTEGLYLFVFCFRGRLELEIDALPVVLEAGDLVPISPLQHLSLLGQSSDAHYYALGFNSNFYCIFGNDHEVGCSGLLFDGSREVFHIRATKEELAEVEGLLGLLYKEYGIVDSYRGESLRILLKRLIITITRLVIKKDYGTLEKQESLELVRQFINLVDQHYLKVHKVQEYAQLLGRSPKTLQAALRAVDKPSPLEIIQERRLAQASRLLLYSKLSSWDIAESLGFDTPASFSRFFKNKMGISPAQYRKQHRAKGNW